MSALEVSRVWKYFGDFPALRDISFSLHSGQCLALLGRNGAGKTTLLRILAGLSRPAKGEVTVFSEHSRALSSRRRIGVLGHGISLYEELSAQENLELFAALYGAPDPRALALDWLHRVDLYNVRQATVREFSRGMRQRLAVARAFLHTPQLLLLDEPFTAMDDRAIAMLHSLLATHLASGGAIVLTTHQIREALELATHVAILERGRLAHFGPRTPEMIENAGSFYQFLREGA